MTDQRPAKGRPMPLNVFPHYSSNGVEGSNRFSFEDDVLLRRCLLEHENSLARTAVVQGVRESIDSEGLTATESA